MNLNCSYCQMPFTLSMAEKVAALRRMQAEGLHHYDAHCPRCGRANAISFDRIKMFTPGWQEAIKQAAPESTPEMGTAQRSTPEPQMASEVSVKVSEKKSSKPAAQATKKVAAKKAKSK